MRILLQSLENLGFEYFFKAHLTILFFTIRETAEILSKESGILLENDLTLNFKKDIINGKWEKALEKLELMDLPKDAINVN